MADLDYSSNRDQRNRRIYDVIDRRTPNISYTPGADSVSIESEALFPPPPKPKPKKQTGATGDTGPAEPQPKPQPKPQYDQPQQQQPQGVFSTNPDLHNALQQHFQDTSAGGGEWYDRAANQANALISQFTGPQVSGGEGPQGLTLRNIIQQGSPYTGGAPLPSTAEATRANQEAIATGPGGGIVPPWNSPTGAPIDRRGEGAQIINTGEPLPPAGWLDRAIAAARAGNSIYQTGATNADVKAGLAYPTGAVSTGNPFEKSSIGTPSGGAMRIPSPGANDNPFVPQTNPGVLYEGTATAANAARESRQNLYQAVQKSTPRYSAFNNDNTQYEGGY